MYGPSSWLTRVLPMQKPQAVATRYAQRRALWKAAIKWPMYSVAVMPVLLAAGWQLGFQGILRWDQLFGFLLAAILLLLCCGVSCAHANWWPRLLPQTQISHW